MKNSKTLKMVQLTILIAIVLLMSFTPVGYLRTAGLEISLLTIPVVIGAAEYPEGIIETLKKDHKVYTVNATEESKKLGNPRVFNLIVLGIAAQHMDFSTEEWYDVIERTVPQKTIEINKKAFDVGYHLVS